MFVLIKYFYRHALSNFTRVQYLRAGNNIHIWQNNRTTFAMPSSSTSMVMAKLIMIEKNKLHENDKLTGYEGNINELNLCNCRESVIPHSYVPYVSACHC
jgi:hypothetical protein